MTIGNINLTVGDINEAVRLQISPFFLMFWFNPGAQTFLLTFLEINPLNDVAFRRGKKTFKPLECPENDLPKNC